MLNTLKTCPWKCGGGQAGGGGAGGGGVVQDTTITGTPRAGPCTAKKVNRLSTFHYKFKKMRGPITYNK